MKLRCEKPSCTSPTFCTGMLFWGGDQRVLSLDSVGLLIRDPLEIHGALEITEPFESASRLECLTLLLGAIHPTIASQLSGNEKLHEPLGPQGHRNACDRFLRCNLRVGCGKIIVESAIWGGLILRKTIPQRSEIRDGLQTRMIRRGSCKVTKLCRRA